MKIKKILASVVAGLSLIAGTGIATSVVSQPVEAAVTNTIPKKFRGTWYAKGYGMYYIERYTANTEGYYDTKTKKSLISDLMEPVSVEVTGKNKCTVWSTSEKNYKIHLTLSYKTYNGKRYKMLAVQKGKNPALYYFNHKINRFYSARRGFIK